MLREILRVGERAKERMFGKVVGYQAVCTGKVENSSMLPFIPGEGDWAVPGGCNWAGKIHRVGNRISAEQASAIAREDREKHQSENKMAVISDFGPGGGHEYHRVKIITLRE